MKQQPGGKTELQWQKRGGLKKKKKPEKSLAVEDGAYAGVGFRQWVGPMFRTHRARKGPGGSGAFAQCGRRDPGVPLALEGGGPGPGPQQAPQAQVGRGNASCIPSDPGGSLPIGLSSSSCPPCP